ncbi:hypothetical protein [Methylotuvimicrobium sp. KM2]|uniref:hypothetical protein n=1 Tax=Methylotuvimicrobium sp. KM2 TaxID=3133976 RepID=UPI003100E2FB
MTDEQSPLERLERMGFCKVGEWRLESGQAKCALIAEANSQNILYAFVVAGLVMYIGKTAQPLKKRLYGYQNPGPTQSH